MLNDRRSVSMEKKHQINPKIQGLSMFVLILTLKVPVNENPIPAGMGMTLVAALISFRLNKHVVGCYLSFCCRSNKNVQLEY